MSKKSKAAEKRKKQEERDKKNSKRNRYKKMRLEGILGDKEIKKYFEKIEELSQYDFIQNSTIYNQLEKIKNPKKPEYNKLTKFYFLVNKNRKYDSWIDEEINNFESSNPSYSSQEHTHD